jgi:RNA-binding protein
MNPLTSGERKYLRSLAHALDPVIWIGKEGVNDNLVAATNSALESHELIKVKFQAFKEVKQRLTQELAEKTESEVAGIIGHVAVLYRQQPDEAKRRIDLAAAL